MLIKQGQIIVLKMRVNNNGTILEPHPYIVLKTDEISNKLEIAQIDSLKGKEYKAVRISNKTIYSDNPTETVIDQDSYVQLDNKLEIEYFDDLVKLRRQSDILSQVKLQLLIDAYKDYHAKHIIDKNKKVYVDKKELRLLNPKL